MVREYYSFENNIKMDEERFVLVMIRNEDLDKVKFTVEYSKSLGASFQVVDSEPKATGLNTFIIFYTKKLHRGDNERLFQVSSLIEPNLRTDS